MNIYFYAHTGHRVGLEHLRRLIPLIHYFENELDGWEVVTLVNDVRARSFGKECGLGRVATIDGVQDIGNIVNDEDVLVFSSEEPSEMMLDEMRSIYPYFVRFDDTLNPIRKGSEIVISPFVSGEGILQALIVNTQVREKNEKSIKSLLFMGDSDYSEESGVKSIEGNPTVLLGHYFSIDLRAKLAKLYTDCREEEDYDDALSQTQHLITGSIQAGIEITLLGGEVTLLDTTHSESVLKSSICQKLNLKLEKLTNNNLTKHNIESIVSVEKLNDVKTVAKYIQSTYWID